MDKPLVSIVIACYNHEAYIQAAIESVLNQSYDNIEFIVIDDGSSDNSVSIIQDLADKHGFHFEAQDNMGLNRTLNKAIELAKGKYFVSFGSDDIMMPDRIEKQVAFMEGHPQYPITSANVVFIDENGVELADQKPAPSRTLEFDDIFLNKKPGIQAAAAMTKLSLFEEHGGYDPDIPLEDIYMWFKLLYAGHKAHCLEDDFAYYRKHASNTYKNVKHMLDSLLKSIEPYNHHPQYQQVRNKLLMSHFLSASKQDSDLAYSILHLMPLGFIATHSMKILRGLKNCILADTS